MHLIRLIPDAVLDQHQHEDLQDLIFYRRSQPDGYCAQFFDCSTLVKDASETAPSECNGMSACITLPIGVRLH
jgi:hypothetical protein